MTGNGQAGCLVRVLGPTEAEVDGIAVPLSPAERIVVSLLAIRPSHFVSAEKLIEALWTGPDAAPASARQSLQNHVGRVRKKLGASVIVSDDDGYRLDAAVDAHVFEQAATAGCTKTSTKALSLWRGEPFVALGAHHEAEVQRTRLRELRTAFEDQRVEALLEAGQHALAVAELERLVDEEPLREQRWLTLATELAQHGRRGDALAVVERARRALARELGIGLGAELRDLERRLVVGPEEFVVAVPQSFVGRRSVIDTAVHAIEHLDPIPVVVGDAGFGKTAAGRLIGSQLRRGGFAVLHISCSEYPSVPLQPFADAIDELIDRCGREVVLDWAGVNRPVIEWLVDGGHGPPPTRSNERNEIASRDWLLDVLVETFATADRAIGPIVIWFDDLHDCPPTSLRLVRRFAQERPVRIGAASRRGDLSEGIAEHCWLVPIGPLQLADVETMLTQEQARGDATRLAQWLFDFTDGHPLLTTELLEHLRRSGHLRLVDGGWVQPDSVELPERIHGLVQAQLDHLGHFERLLIENAAVLGTLVDTEVLCTVASRADLVSVLALPNTLLAHHDQRHVRFRHALLTQAVYDAIPSGRRVEMHDAIANLLDDGTHQSSELARHRIAASQLNPDGALQAAISAGDDARASLQFQEARQWYGAAEELVDLHGAPDEAVALELAIHLGDTLRLSGDVENLAVLLRAAERAAELGRFDLLSKAAFAMLQLGSASESGHLNRQVLQLGELALAHETDPVERAQLGAAMSVTLAMGGEAQRCRDLFAEAEKTARDTGDPAAISSVLPFTYMALGLPEDLEQRAENGSWLVAYGQSLDDPIAEFEGRHLLFSVALSRGEGEALRRHHQSMLDLLPRVGDVGRTWSAAYQSAALAYLDGDLDGCERQAERSLTIAGEFMASRAMAAYSAQLLILRYTQDRLGELLPTLDAMIEDQPLMPAWRAAAALASAPHDPERVRAEFDVIAPNGFVSLPRDFTWIPTVLIAGLAVASIGDEDRSEQASAVLRPYSGLFCWQGTCSYGPIDTALAHLAIAMSDNDAARSYATRAIEQSVRIGSPLFEAQATSVLTRAQASG